MLDLSGVTLCCIDTVNHALVMRALARSRAGISFERSLWLTSELPAGLRQLVDVEIVDIPELRSHVGYSQFVLKELPQYITTPHVLLIQWDGFVVNPQVWDAAFLDCDYLGAKWFWHGDGMRVGNGGFSLRSKRLLNALQDPRILLRGAEDETIGRSFRPLLERDHGIRFGSEELADRFSFEASYPVGEPFGFHGLFNFCRTVPQGEIAAMAQEFSDAILRSPQLQQLLRNCAAMGQWHAVAAIAARVLAITPNAIEVRDLLERARTGIAQPNVGRNAPCPCGSGRKFKQCHGAIATPTAAQHGVPSMTSANNVLPLPARGDMASTPAVTTAVPPNTDQLVQRALTAHRQHQLDAAEHGYRAALAQSPEHAIATHYLGVILYQRNRTDEALPLLQRAAAAIPHEPEFHNNLGLALAAVDRNEEAISAYRRALANNPAHTTSWNNLGLVLQACNRLDDAIAAFCEAVRLQPDFGQVHWNLALALLCAGEFEGGWREYEWRLALPELGAREVLPPARRWNGTDAMGKTLLLTAEQGLGDALQFTRFAQPLAALGMRVLIRAPAVLQHLLATVPGVSAAYATEEPLPDHDAHLPLLSVPGVLRIRGDTIPGETPYLTADPARRMALRNRLLSLPGRRRNIGICWAGNPQHGNDRRRSLSMAGLCSLIDREDERWFSLQRDSATGPPLIDWMARNDFDDLAALIAELDLVISVDTSVAHLAGALGRPTWVLLPFAPDWRWGLYRENSPWYPAMRLFRQRATGDWSTVIEDVHAALQVE